MVQSGKQNAFIREFGCMAFDYARENQDYAERFKQAMTSYSAVQSSLVLEALRGYDFSRIRTCCDVAGGYRHLMCALLLANPGLRGIVLLDLPEVVEDVHELGGRISSIRLTVPTPRPRAARASASPSPSRSSKGMAVAFGWSLRRNCTQCLTLAK